MPDQIQKKGSEEDGASGTMYLMSYEVPGIQLLVGVGRIDIHSTKFVGICNGREKIGYEAMGFPQGDT